VSPEEQCRAFARSHVVVAMHGSALGNLLCAMPGGVVVEVHRAVGDMRHQCGGASAVMRGEREGAPAEAVCRARPSGLFWLAAAVTGASAWRSLSPSPFPPTLLKLSLPAPFGQVFSPGFYLEMFGLLATAVDVHNVQVR